MNFNVPNYILPCLRQRDSSIDSVWLDPSDFGECYHIPSDSQLYPCLTPVYNGKKLNVNPELVHASLSGISIKHYYGKCFQEPEEGEFFIEPTHEYGSDLFEHEEPASSIVTPPKTPVKDLEESTTDDSFDYKNDSLEDEFIKPICMQYKINAITSRQENGTTQFKSYTMHFTDYTSVALSIDEKESRFQFRNSFWNVHRPELCKLTWPQKYVSTVTVIEHLHEHLLFHGPLCTDYHEEEDRINMLNRELDEYGTLKELLSPRELPPDEKFMNFKFDENEFFKALTENPRCLGKAKFDRKPVFDPKERFLHLSDDEETEGKDIRRLKEEFCLTIGKHIRKPPITIPDYCPEEEFYIPSIPCGAEEEGGISWQYEWDLYPAEESYQKDDTTSEEDLSFDSTSLFDPCPPLKMDDFCRSVAKADFSDLRCNPDDF